MAMLESAMDRVLGVDTLGQQLSPRARYGTTCLLIRNVVGSVLRAWYGTTCLGSHGARGVAVPLLA
jgi:hypothetical protein